MSRVTGALVLVMLAVAAADVVITEICYDPSGDDGFSNQGCTEWIEILNTGPGNVDLTGWTFEDRNGSFGTLIAGNDDLMLAPGEYAVLIPIDSASNHVGSPANYLAAWNIPAPPAAEIVIIDGWASEQLRNDERSH